MISAIRLFPLRNTLLLPSWLFHFYFLFQPPHWSHSSGSLISILFSLSFLFVLVPDRTCYLKIVAEVGQNSVKDWQKVAKIQNSALRFLSQGFFFFFFFNSPFTLKKLRLDILDNVLYKNDDVGMPISEPILKEE